MSIPKSGIYSSTSFDWLLLKERALFSHSPTLRLSDSPTLGHKENSSVGQAFCIHSIQTPVQLKIRLKDCIKYIVASWSQNNTDKMMAKHEMKILINCNSVWLNKNYIYIPRLLMIYWSEWTKAFSLQKKRTIKALSSFQKTNASLWPLKYEIAINTRESVSLWNDQSKI